MKDNLNSQIKSRLELATKILLVTHKDPDGDACGSILAFYLFLTARGKQVTILTANQPAKYYDFMFKIEMIKTDLNLLDENWDQVIVFDCGDLNHTGLPENKLRQHDLICIDHHQSNQAFGILNLVDFSASSTCELVYDYLSQNKIIITQPIANCLLTGIMTDTGGFSNAGTTAKAIAVAAELVSCGANLSRITNQVIKNKTVAGLRVWGILFSRLKINKEYNIAYTYIHSQELERFHVSDNEIDGFVNFLNVIAGVKAALFLRLDDQKVKVSMRTKRNDVDLSKLAQYFGGGGHQKAAGFTVNWEVEEKNGRLKFV